MGAYLQFFPTPRGLPQCSSGSAPPITPTPISAGRGLTTLQCSLYAAARMVASLPGSVRPNAKHRPPKTFTPELSPEAITRLRSRV